ncbi:MAG: cysteine synthase family protein [Planctomycetes bacterium]|nr:cysteine synthase family protein [Planctomycetota bacterium]
MPTPPPDDDYCPPLCDSILGVIGHTPMVELRRFVESRNLRGRILAKLEHLNPGFSKKDRIALEIMREARASGDLKPGQTVVELTSGNTGTGLAIVCRSMGHPFVAVMSRGNTIERARMMAALGARVELVDQAPGAVPGQVSGNDLALVEQRARQLVKELHAFRANQFELQGNVLAHERHTGPEIWRQAGGKVDVFVDLPGTAGSFTGVARFLKRSNPALRAYVVEPATAPVLAGKPVTNPSHKIQGGGYAIADLPLLDRSLVTDYLTVTDDDATAAARALASEEGIFAGFSAGANLAAAAQLLKGREAGATVVILICDSGLKYLSTDLHPPL